MRRIKSDYLPGEKSRARARESPPPERRKLAREPASARTRELAPATRSPQLRGEEPPRVEVRAFSHFFRRGARYTPPTTFRSEERRTRLRVGACSMARGERRACALSAARMPVPRLSCERAFSFSPFLLRELFTLNGLIAWGRFHDYKSSAFGSFFRQRVWNREAVDYQLRWICVIKE